MADQLVFGERAGRGIATVMARKDVGAGAIGEALGLQLADGPVAVTQGTMLAVGTGPGTWLVMDDAAAHDFADVLQERLSGLASVSDQSSGYAIFQLTGPGARTVLQRGAAIDFHPDCFGPGCVATTVIAHIGAIIRQVDDLPSFEVAVFRSLSGSFRHWLTEAAAAL
ncbi:MAG: sarcosine oxidase subunit gamma family protein [Novosphingobium sp.]